MFGKGEETPAETGRTRAAAKYLAGELERLMNLPLSTEADLKNWYAEFGNVQRVLLKRFPGFEFNHEVWHFFADADIRARDNAARERQHRIISDYVADLRK